MIKKMESPRKKWSIFDLRSDLQWKHKYMWNTTFRIAHVMTRVGQGWFLCKLVTWPSSVLAVLRQKALSSLSVLLEVMKKKRKGLLPTGYVQVVKMQSERPYVNSLSRFGCLQVIVSIKSHSQVRFHASTPHHFQKNDFWSFTFLRLIIVVFDILHPYKDSSKLRMNLTRGGKKKTFHPT